MGEKLQRIVLGPQGLSHRLLKAFLFSGLVILVTHPASAIQRWEHYYSWDYNEEGRSIIENPDSSLIVAGETTSYGPGAPDHANFYMIKLDPAGTMIWRKIYGTDADEYATAVDRSPDGGYFIAGSRQISPTDDDFLAIRTDGAGTAIWTEKYGRPGWWDDCMAARTCRDGGYVLVGVTAQYGTPGDVYVVRVNLRGETIWSTYWGAGFADDQPYSIQETTDGGFIIGLTRIFLGSPVRYICLLKLDAFGRVDWTRDYPGPTNCLGAIQTADGGYIVTGAIQPPGSYFSDVFVLKVDSAGNKLWTVQWGGPDGSDVGFAVCQLTDGTYVVCGTTQTDVLSHWQLLGMRIDQKGHIVWTRTFGGRLDEAGWAVCATRDGGAALCGYETGSGPGTGIYVVKIDRDGNSAGASDPAMQPLRQITTTPLFANPFRTFASIPGSGQRFDVYDVLGRRVGEYGGARIGEDLAPGVYLMRRAGSRDPAVRIVKIR